MEQNFEDMTPAERVLHVQDLWDRIAEHLNQVEAEAEGETMLAGGLAEEQR